MWSARFASCVPPFTFPALSDLMLLSLTCAKSSLSRSAKEISVSGHVFSENLDACIGQVHRSHAGLY